MNFINGSMNHTTYALEGSFPITSGGNGLTLRNGLILQEVDSGLATHVIFEDNIDPIEEEVKATDTSDNIDEFIETIISYKCILCSYESKDKSEVASHVRFTHVAEINGSSNEEGKVEVVAEEEPLPDNESSNGNTQTVYMCGGCSSPFVTLAQCKAHMNQHLKGGVCSSKKKEVLEVKVESSEAGSEDVDKAEVKRQTDYSCPDLTKEKPIKCSVKGCQIKFSSDELMTRHRECHSTDPSSSSFSCTKCHFKFNKWPLLAAHLWRIHFIDVDLFKCSVCKYRSASRVHLGKHFKMHCAGAGEFPCVQCGKLFEEKSDLSDHIASEHPEDCPPPVAKKPVIECPECRKQLSDIRSLKKHIKCVHGQLRPYVCQVCGFSSKTRDTLRLHTRQHTGEKPYSCDFCPFKSRDHNTMRRHNLKHSGVKPYPCKHCPYSASQSNALILHMMKFHPDKDGLFACSSCTFSTLSQVLFDNHLRVHHKEGRSKNSGDSNQERNFGSMFPSSKTKEIVRVYPAGVEDEESSSQCYFDTDHVDTGGITIPAEETKVEAAKDVQSQMSS